MVSEITWAAKLNCCFYVSEIRIHLNVRRGLNKKESEIYARIGNHS